MTRICLPLARRLGSVTPVTLAALVALVALMSACAKTYIPNTDVEDTGANRSVIEFCETYRHAFEDKNVGQLVKLMSPGYFEDGGNTKPEDDAGLRRHSCVSHRRFLEDDRIRYEIRYRRITFSENATSTSTTPTRRRVGSSPEQAIDEWHHSVSDNRLGLVRDADSFKIVAGM